MKIIMYTVYSDGTLEHADESGINQRIAPGTYAYTTFLQETISNGYLPIFCHTAIFLERSLPIFEIGQ